MAAQAGLEPATNGLTVLVKSLGKCYNGSCGRLRTYNAIKRWINSPLSLPVPLHKNNIKG